MEVNKNLKRTSEKAFEDEKYQNKIADAPNKAGFHVRNSDGEMISKVFGRAGEKYIKLANENSQDAKSQLLHVLCQPFTRYLKSQLTPPQDIANIIVFKIAEQDTQPDITNLIECNTESKNLVREPEEFIFYNYNYKDCDLGEEKDPQDVPMEVRTKHLQYNPRKAHVKMQLYRYCRTRPKIEYKTNQLCPPVYIRRVNSWVKWFPSRSIRKAFQVNSLHFNWMNRHIKEYILSDKIEIQWKDHQETITRPTLYWAVVQDTDFEEGEHLQLNDIGKTQVYVGISANGINERWFTANSSHCKMMKKCLDNVQAMTTYDPSRLEGIQLVDARLLLAKLREEKCALFVMKTYEKTQAGKKQMETDEKLHINGDFPGNEPILKACPDWKPMSMAYGMNAQ